MSMPIERSPAASNSGAAMASDQIMLKRRRTVIKASCTRMETYINAVRDITPEIRAQLEERRERLDTFWKDYRNVQAQLESLDENEANDRIGFEETFYDLCAKFRHRLQVRCSHADAQTLSTQGPSRTGVESSTYIRLPKLNLPVFSGKYDEWFPFHDTFITVIHNNNSLGNIQKFQYLRSSLTDKAADIIKSLEISDANYDLAWNILKERYENKRVIVQAHVQAILDLPTMTKENAESLRRLADGVSSHIRALTALKCHADKWDALLIQILSAKLDTVTSREWHASLRGTELPELREFIEFLSHRGQVLEESLKRSAAASVRSDVRSQSRFGDKRQALHATAERGKCTYCGGAHLVYFCKGFLALSVERRIAEARGRKLCLNCLRASSHVAAGCSSGGCRTCKLKHNTLLHITRDGEAAGAGVDVRATADSSAASDNNVTIVTHSAAGRDSAGVMLSTALVYTRDVHGGRRTCRVLLDSGSQANFISKACVESLRLKTRTVNISISGIGGAASVSNRVARVGVRSRLNSFATELDCIVTDRITGRIPAVTIDRRVFKLPSGVELADPRFNVASDIEILIGAEVFWQLICVGQIGANAEHPTLQKTRLGWVLAGRAGVDLSHSATELRALHASVGDSQLHERVNRFWLIEELATACSFTKEEQACEEHFVKNVSRDESGRYIVKLPIKEDVIHRLGESRTMAMRRFHSLERRFGRDSHFRHVYSQFIHEYITLGHMRRVPACALDDGAVYLPHHGVFKEADRGAKLRVVFDASGRTSTGVSLNEALMTGPTIQRDLVSILMRFRAFAHVFTADIIKMYRQIWIHESQTHLQRILWRDNPSVPIDTYELLTVTYGTSSAPFLAIRCLQHLAQKYAAEYPLGSRCVLRDFYVDDLLAGADTLVEARRMRDEVVELLRRGGFELSKWSSNCRELLPDVEDAEIAGKDLNKEPGSRVLGVIWHPAGDDFRFAYTCDSPADRITRRTMLSEIASLFDPLGLLGPFIVMAKLILQETWQSQLGWDESLPLSIHTRWLALKGQLRYLDGLRVPRFVDFGSGAKRVQLHGFCDASERAYGACVYVRARDSDGYRVSLLISKSRIAPIRAISLPRLELCAAVLLAKLVDKVRSSIDGSGAELFLWTDSTIVLQWIRSSSRRWNAFVANRVGEIQRLTGDAKWRHVPSASNPADMLSRGVELSILIDFTMWWGGPDFLQRTEEHWPAKNIELPVELPEQKRVTVATASVDRSVVLFLLERHSSVDKTLRVIAYCRRFMRPRRVESRELFVSHYEMTAALQIVVRSVQREVFAEEFKSLSGGRGIGALSRVLSLTPFLDKEGIIRVGGRIGNSELPYDARHPMLLPNSHRLTTLIIRREHVRGLHSGLQATMHAVRQRFWPLAARSAVRRVIHLCVRCFKCRPNASRALMAELPKSRVTVSRPFTHTGVDYAGPIMVKEGKRRNARMHKAYISVFVCFATKAVHLEIVSDLASDAFLGAFKRFIARRGRPTYMYSDNGTTFVGANKQIKELYKAINDEPLQAAIKNFMRKNEITWKFIPPHAPHFGGLWEAAVKSAKYHMYRVVGNANLTFEETQTVLCEIEAALNSRPLTPLSADPNDVSCVTPGHFLIGAALNSLPVPDLTEEIPGRLSRWQRVEQVRQHFWRRWSAEYLHTLVERRKWRASKGKQLEVGQLVMVQQPGLGPLQWILGRVQQLHPGADGIARTATLRTARGQLTRALTKLAILPIETFKVD